MSKKGNANYKEVIFWINSMATLEPILIDFIFENCGLLKEESLVESVSKLIRLEKYQITNQIISIRNHV